MIRSAMRWMAVLAVIAVAVPMFGASFTTSQSGNWNSASTWGGAGVPGAGDSATVNHAVTLDVSPTVSILTLNNSVSGAQTLTATSILQWNGGTVGGGCNLTVPSGATATLLGYPTLASSTLTIGGAFNLTSSYYVYLTGSASIVNNGTITFQGDEGLYPNGAGTQSIVNNGTIQKTGGTGNGAIQVAITANSGSSISIQSGTMLFGNITSTGATLSTTTGATSTFYYTTSSSFDAASAINGSGSVVFTAGTNTVSGTYSVSGSTTISGGTATINSPANTGNVTVSSGTLTLNAGSTVTIPTLTMNGGTLNGTAPLTVTNTSLTWTGGTLGGSGALTIPTGTTVTMNGYVNFDARPVTSNGTFVYSGNYYSYLYNSAVFTNNGTITLQGDGGIYIGSGSPSLVNNGTIQKTGGTGGGGAIHVPLTSNSGSQVLVQSGLLYFNNMTFTGATLDVSSGATAIIYYGTASSFDAASTISGAGTVQFSSGTTTASAAYNVTGATVCTGGTATISNPVSLGNVTNNGGALTVTSASAPSVGNLTLTGGTLTLNTAPLSIPVVTMGGGTLAGTASITITGSSLTWTGGTIAGSGTFTIPNSTTVAVNGYVSFDTRSVTNGGVMTYSGNYYSSLSNGAVFTNNGTVTFQGDGGFYNGSGLGSIVNNGTIQKTGGTGGGALQPSLTANSGSTLSVQSGTLYIGNVTSTGSTLSVTSGAVARFYYTSTSSFDAASTISGAGTVEFDAGTNTVNASYNVTGTTASGGGTTTLNSIVSLGTVNAAGGTLTINSATAPSVSSITVGGGTLTLNIPTSLTVASLTMTGGTLNGTAQLSVTNTSLTWTGGTLGGTGSLTIPNTTTVTFNGYLTYDTLSIINYGSFVYTGNYYSYLTNGANFSNHGTITFQGDGGFYNGTGSNSLVNLGTVQKSGGSGNGTLQVPVTANSGSQILVQSGSLLLGNITSTGSTLSVSSGATAWFYYTTAANFDAASSITGTGTVLWNAGANTVDASYGVTGTTTMSGGTTTINNVTAVATLTVNGGTLVINGASAVSFTSIAVSAGTLNLNAATSVPALSLTSSGVIGGSGALTVTGTLSWTGGTMNGTGSTTIANTVTSSVIGGSNVKYFYRTINLNVNTTFSSSVYSYGGNSGVVNVNATLDIQTDQPFYYACCSGNTTLVVNGTLTKSAGTGTASFDWIVNNAGTINANSGTLALNGGGTDTGAFAIASGASLQFNGGTHTLTGTVSGTGTFTVSSGQVDVNSAYNASTTVSVPAGTLNFNNTASTTGLSLSSSGVIGGTGALTVTGTFSWTGGTMNGTGSTTIANTVTSSAIGGSNVKYFYRTINFDANTTYTSSVYSYGGSSSVVTINAGKTLDIQTDQPFYYACCSGNTTLVVNGTLSRSAGTGTASFDWIVNDAGTVAANSGTLALNGGGTHTGAFAIASGASLQFNGGTHTLSGTVSGTGTFTVSSGQVDVNSAYNASTTVNAAGGTLNFNNTASTAALTQSGSAVIGGTGALTVTGTFDWTGGTMNGAGSTTIAGTVTSSLIHGSNVHYFYRNITFNADTTYAPSVYSYGSNASAITIGAGKTFDIQADQPFYYSCCGGNTTFVVNGTLLKSGGSGATQLDWIVNNAGTVSVTNGTLNLTGGGTDSGAFVIASGATMQFGGGTHTLTGSASGTGTFAVSAGQVDVNSAYNASTAVNVTGGVLNFNNTASTAGLALSNSGTIGGSGALTVTGTFSWNGGGMSGSGSTTIAGTVTSSTIGGSNVHYFYRNITFNANTTYAPAVYAYGNNASVVTIGSGTTFDIQTDQPFYYACCSGNTTLVVNGTLMKSGGTGISPIDWVVTNNQTIKPASGTLRFNNGLTQNGSLYFPISGPTGYGTINVPGAFALGGNLTAVPVNAYTPPSGTTFPIITYGSYSGAFATKNLTFAGGSFNDGYSPTTLTLTSQNASCVTPPTGLVGWWRGEGNANDSIGPNNGTLVGGAITAAGEVGQAFSLNGSTQYVSIADSPSLRPASLSAEAWVKFTGSPVGTTLILGKPYGSGTQDSFCIWLQNGNLNAGVNLNAPGALTASFNPTIGTWYHVAFTYDASNGAAVLYLDGAPVSNTTMSAPVLYDSHPLLIGADVDNGTTFGFFPGFIDEMTLYSRALSSAEVLNIYNATTAGKCYTAPAAPTITNVSPASGSTSGGDSVTITGTGLDSVSSVTFGGTSAIVNSQTSTTLLVTTPAHSAGSVTVAVTNPGGTANSSFTYTTFDADLSAAINSAPATVATNGTFTYGVTFTNNGPSSAVSFSGTTSVSTGSITNVTYGGPVTCSNTTTTVTCTASTFASGASASLTVTVTAPSSAGSLIITAAASSTTADSNGSNNSGTHSVSVTTAPSFITVTSNADSGAGTLRQAIIDANAGACTLPCTIAFNLPGGSETIALSSALPSLMAGQITIDGTTQPTFVSTPVVTLNGSALTIPQSLRGAASASLISASPVLTVASSSNTIRALSVIANPVAGGISITGNSNTIKGCYVGVTPAGIANGNNGDGIFVTGSGNTIGGTTAADRNVVSANGGRGIVFSGTAATNNLVYGNYVGVLPDGATAAAQGADGIAILDGATFNAIGNGTSPARNVISGNSNSGVAITSSTANLSAHNTVNLNYIGVTATGSTARANHDGVWISDNAGLNSVLNNVIAANTGFGVYLSGAQSGNTITTNNIGVGADNTTQLGNGWGVVADFGAAGATIGGTSPSLGNVIAYNTKGVWIDSGATGIAVIGNSIHNNGGLGIDLEGDGITPNDSGDSDTGVANGYQNFPVITAASFGAGMLNVTLSVDSSAVASTQSLRVEVYKADASGQGQTYLGSNCFTTNSLINGNLAIPTASVAAGNSIVASATSYSDAGCTNVSDGTSEFSAAFTVACAPPAATITAPASVCPNSSGNTASVPFTSGASYNWTISGGTITAGAGSSAITFSAGASGNVVLGVSVTSGACTGTGSANVAINAVTPLITAPSTVCANATTSASTAAVAGASFNWTISGGTINSGQGTNTIIFTAAASGTVSLGVTVTNSASCSGNATASVAINPTPNATIAAPASVCANANASASVATIAGASYNWTITNGTIASGQGTSSITFTAPASGNVVLAVSVTSNSCTSSSSTNVAVTPPPAATIAAPATACAGGTVTASVPATAGASYVWTLTGASIASGQGTSSITFTAPGSGSVGIAIAVTSSSCTSNGTATVNVGAPPAVSINAPATACANSSVTASVAAQAGASYAWTLNGATIGSGQGTNSITFTAPASGSVAIGVSVTNGGCVSNASATVSVASSLSLTLVAPSSTTANSTSNTASVDSIPGATYAWSISNGSITTGQGTNVIRFTAGASGSVSIGVTVTSASCSSTKSATVSITAPPLQTADLAVSMSAAPNVVAPNGAVSFNITVKNNGPNNAANVSVNTSLTGGTFVSSNSATFTCASTTCTAASLPSGTTASISISVNAPASGTSLSATSSVTSSTTDPETSNNSASAAATITQPSCGTSAPSLISPADGASAPAPVTFTWSSVSNATQYDLWAAADGGPFSLVGSTASTTLTANLAGKSIEWFVAARFAGDCPAINSTHRSFTIITSSSCDGHLAPALNSPLGGSVGSPVTFSWQASPGAAGYKVWISVDGAALQDIGTTSGATTLTVAVPSGSITWSVDALFAGCPAVRSATGAFNVTKPDPCATRAAATLIAPADASTHPASKVTFQWSAAANASGYRVWTSIDGADFNALPTTTDTSLDTVINSGHVEWYVETLFAGCSSLESPHRTFDIPHAANCGANGKASNLAPSSDTNKASVTFSWSAAQGATSYEVWLALENGSPSLLGTTAATSLTHDVPAGALDWFVRANFDGCPATESAHAHFAYVPPAACTDERPLLFSPISGASGVYSPVSFSWKGVTGATGYKLFLSTNNGAPTLFASTTETHLDNAAVPTGVLDWSVEATLPGCSPAASSTSRFTVTAKPSGCPALTAPVIATPSSASSGVRYTIRWNRVGGAETYVIQSADNAQFNNAAFNSTADDHYDFLTSNGTSSPITMYFRVRALATCQPQPGPYSTTTAVVILPSVASAKQLQGALPADAAETVSYTIPLDKSLAGLSFVATPNQSFVTVSPTSGVVPAGGMNLTVTVDTSHLAIGTSTAGVTITTSSPSASHTGAMTSTSTTTTVSVSLVSPVVPTSKSTPPPDALIIPAVAHADGVNSKFQSDVRVTNSSAQSMKYQVTFTPTGENGADDTKQTTIDIDAGRTVALDDILGTWFTSGATVGSIGTLEIRPLTTSSTANAAFNAINSLSTFASSRTFNVTSNGTFGQYIPAIPFGSFVGLSKDAKAPSILSLQQIAQSDAYRTNLGLVEGSGQPASVLVTVFGKDGAKITDFPINLSAGQHTQFSLGSQGVTNLTDGRVEVKVVSPGGKVTAYASVLDNNTSDPLLVSPVNLSAAGNTKFVIPGVADLNNGLANWRTDMRVFNASSKPVDATLTFVSQSGGEPKSIPLTLAPNEVKTFDNTLASAFGITNDGGAVHISTLQATNLIATARTYNQTSNGTYGQFIPAVTPLDAIGTGSRPLQVLQLEESDRYRSNVGIAEVSGKAATVQISVVPADGRVTGSIQLDLAPNEFRQLNSMLKSFGTGTAYNARVTVKVISGEGRVTAYASVIDQVTQDPTYVPAQ